MSYPDRDPYAAQWAEGVTHPFNPFGAGRVLEAGEGGQDG